MTEKGDVVDGVYEIITNDLLAEVIKSVDKWGVQNHPDGTSGFPHARHRANEYRALTQRHATAGHVTWWDVLLEEVYEAGAETEYAPLRAELLQVANVAALWVDCLDRREAARVAIASPRSALEGSAEQPAQEVPDCLCNSLYGGLCHHAVDLRELVNA